LASWDARPVAETGKVDPDLLWWRGKKSSKQIKTVLKGCVGKGREIGGRVCVGVRENGREREARGREQYLKVTTRSVLRERVTRHSFLEHALTGAGITHVAGLTEVYYPSRTVLT